LGFHADHIRGEVAIIKRLVTVALFFLTFVLLTFVTVTAAAGDDSSAVPAPPEAARTGIPSAKPNETDYESGAESGTAAESAAESGAAAEAVSGAGMNIGAAAKLNLLGLFRGVGVFADGSPNLAVDRAPTRAEAVVMVVRLIGGEAEALSGSWKSPFADVPEWAKPYVGYAYGNNLVFGVGGGAFSGNSAITASEYITLVLRSLGYASGTDFDCSKAWVLSDEIGITGGRYSAETKQFSRGNAAEILFNALGAKMKGSDNTLCTLLIGAGVFTKDAASALGAGVISEVPVPMSGLPQPTAPDSATASEVESGQGHNIAPGASDMEREVFVLVNKEREKAGLYALVWNEELAAVARAHSADMSKRNYFNHISPEGDRPPDRIRGAGLAVLYSAENIARGHRTAEAVVAAWMASATHKSAILSEHAVSIGVGFYEYYWTMNLISQ